MNKDVVYANIGQKYAIGYLNWYEQNFKQVSVNMFSNQYSPDLLLKIQEACEKQKFHFAARIRKSYCFSIPRTVLMMKLRHFLREIADDVIEKTNPKQLEFKF